MDVAKESEYRLDRGYLSYLERLDITAFAAQPLVAVKCCQVFCPTLSAVVC